MSSDVFVSPCEKGVRNKGALHGFRPMRPVVKQGRVKYQNRRSSESPSVRTAIKTFYYSIIARRPQL